MTAREDLLSLKCSVFCVQSAGESPEEGEEHYVLKHISSRKGERARRSGRREAYFGARLQLNRTLIGSEDSASSDGLEHLVRFVESFEVRSLGTHDVKILQAAPSPVTGEAARPNVHGLIQSQSQPVCAGDCVLHVSLPN